MERRLAAILAADVVGYTRLMGADEMGTLERLTTLREQVLGPRFLAQRLGKRHALPQPRARSPAARSSSNVGVARVKVAPSIPMSAPAQT